MMRSIAAIVAVGALLCACPGPDYMPVYFPQAETSTSESPPPPKPPPGTACTVQLRATLCVTIKGEKVDVGTITAEPLCVENVPPIPMEIVGGTVTLRGDLFPDITVEGHGLPVPITINGRGTTDGRGNEGRGTIDSAGNISIDNFSFYVEALGKFGQIPALTLTTGSVGPIGELPERNGSPVDAGGNVELVTGTKLGSLFPGADELLQGAALMASLTGSISPPLSECGASAHPTTFEIVKLVLDAQGQEVAVPIPNGDQMEVATGTFIATDPTDVGPRFESTAKFRLVNISDAPIGVQIAPAVGPFLIASPSALNRTIPPKGMMILRVTFRPQHATVKQAGLVTQSLAIGPDTFYLTGTALDPAGRVGVDLLDARGTVTRENVEQIDIGEVAVAATTQRAYFQCATQLCGNLPLPTACQPCIDVTTGKCRLLTVGAEGEPLDEVTAACQPAHPRARETPLINIEGGGDRGPQPTQQILAIRNTGPKPFTLTTLTLKEIVNSQSTGQFHFAAEGVFVAASFEAVAAQLKETSASANGGCASGAGGCAEASDGATAAGLPMTLPPYEPPLTTTRAFIVVGYAPNDLKGSDGRKAGVGTTVTDQAELHVESDGATAIVRIKGATTIKDIPPLQVFFTTATGRKDRADGQTFAFRGITGATTDLAVPLFLRATEGATHAIRVTGVALSGPDVANFEWLDSIEEIAAKPEGARCTIPIFDPAGGGQTGSIATLKPVSLVPRGYDLKPGAHTLETMPLFGCVNFHRAATDGATQRQYAATLTVTAQHLGSDGRPIKNPDGSLKESRLRIPLTAVINPRAGKMVLRLTQTMSAMLNPKFPGIASVSTQKELAAQIAAGAAESSDAFVFLGSMILDPFDEETIVNERGETLSAPGDGVTGIFRAVDTRPSPVDYADPTLPDFATLTFDATAPEGQRGVFFDYPNVPPDFKASALRIYTATISWPGPFVAPSERPEQPSSCEFVDPCAPSGQRKFAEGPSQPGKKGVCAFFFTSAGDYQSPAFHHANEMEGGTRQDLCLQRDQPQQLLDWRGKYSLDGSLNFEDGGLRFWGPTYFHNPNGLLGPVPPLDEVYHITFTTETLLPATETPGLDLIPETRINFAKQEHKLNLTDPTLESPAVCANNTRNQLFRGKLYSTWRYMAPLLSKDPKGEIAAGCPEEGSPFTGGSAFLHGRPVDHETGVMTVVANAKFSSNKDLTFAFQDVTIFIVLNGWLCDPTGSPDALEGERCYDRVQNERDGKAQISIME